MNSKWFSFSNTLNISSKLRLEKILTVIFVVVFLSSCDPQCKQIDRTCTNDRVIVDTNFYYDGVEKTASKSTKIWSLLLISILIGAVIAVLQRGDSKTIRDTTIILGIISGILAGLQEIDFFKQNTTALSRESELICHELNAFKSKMCDKNLSNSDELAHYLLRLDDLGKSIQQIKGDYKDQPLQTGNKSTVPSFPLITSAYASNLINIIQRDTIVHFTSGQKKGISLQALGGGKFTLALKDGSKHSFAMPQSYFSNNVKKSDESSFYILGLGYDSLLTNAFLKAKLSGVRSLRYLLRSISSREHESEIENEAMLGLVNEIAYDDYVRDSGGSYAFLVLYKVSFSSFNIISELFKLSKSEQIEVESSIRNSDFMISPVYEPSLKVHVLDVGPGLCNLIELPDGKYILYDAGHYRELGSSSFRQIEEIIPSGREIELMVLSHTDADHVGAASQVLQNYRVKKIVHTGYDKSKFGGENTGTYKRFQSALNEVSYPLEEINLNESDSTIAPGTQLNFGNVNLTFLCGFGKPLSEWGLTSISNNLNSVSIVMSIDFQGKSILFSGDAVGKLREFEPLATENYLLENSKEWLDVDVVIAPHHGADNGSSRAFIEATSPEYVIFSSGHSHGHPRASTAQRYLDFGVPIRKVFRTDRGDDESNTAEWKYTSIPQCRDNYGDDNIQILITNGSISVEYVNGDGFCY